MDTQRSDKSDDAAKPLDAAVQRALVEAREEMLVFLQRRLRNRDDAEEVLQRLSFGRWSAHLNSEISAPFGAGWAASSPPPWLTISGT